MTCRTLVYIACLFLFLTGTTVLTAQQISTPLTRLLLPVKQGKLWGYADTSRRIVITPQFDLANPFEGRIAVVEKNRKAYAIDSSGKILTPGFDQVFVIEDSVLSVYVNQVGDTLGGWGLSTVGGRLIVRPMYDEIEKLSTELYCIRKDSLWGVVTRSGRIIIEPKYDEIRLARYGNLQVRSGKYSGVVSGEGAVILAPRYREVSFPGNLLVAGCLQTKKKKNWGAVNYSGDTIVPFVYDSLFAISSWFTGVTKHDSIGCYFPATNAPELKCIFKAHQAVDRFWVKFYNFSGKCGLFDTLGNAIVPVAYREIDIGGNGNWLVTDSAGRLGFYSADGRLMLAPSYTRIDPFRGRLAVVYDKNGQGLINDKGELLEAPGDQKIIIRGNTVKVLRSDSSAVFLTIDNEGRVSDRNSYDEFRVIKIGGRESTITTATGMILRNGQLPQQRYVPKVDSLSWFFDRKNHLFGLRNSYTSDTIIPAIYEQVSPAGSFYMLVYISDTTESMSIDGRTSYARYRVGLVNDTSGKIVLKPVYTAIMLEDLLPHGYSGCVRATLPGGQMAIVSTDGSERRLPVTWAEKVSNGYARFCIQGRWTINDPGEHVNTLEIFANEQSLQPFLSFGVSATSKTFMEKAIRIAGGKWGYVDSTGRVIIQPVYEGAKASRKATGIVKQNKKWGLIDMQNRTIIPCTYDALNYLGTDTSVLVTAQANGIRYGYIDRNGNIAIPADLKLSKSLGNGFIGFSRTGKWGVMRTNGQIVCGEEYREILPFSEGFAAVKKGNRWGYIDTNGTEVVEPVYERAGNYRNGMARVVTKSRWGYIDKEGRLVVEAVFLQAGDFAGGAAPVRTREGYGLTDKDGKWLAKPQWSSLNLLDSGGTAFFVARNDRACGLLNRYGKWVVGMKYEAFRYLGEGRIACMSGNSWYLLDTTGKVVSAGSFGQIKPFTEGKAAATNGIAWGYIRTDGKYVIAPQFEAAAPFVDNMAYTIIDKTGQFIDTNGRVVIRIKKTDVLLAYSEGKYLMGKLDDHKEIKYMYFMTRHGVKVNRIQFKEAMPFENGAARVRVNGRQWGLISYTGYFIVKPRFFLLGSFDNGLARFQMQYTLGLFTIDGKPVLPVAYDAIVYDESLGMIRYERSNSMGYLHANGSSCWPESE